MVTGAHPRSRGEHTISSTSTSSSSGSSPLARGTLSRAARNIKPPGLIPARAGNTSRGLTPRLCRWAHPRSRGEHVEGMGRVNHQLGSSPLARGTPPGFTPKLDRSGLIPARAGNTDGYRVIGCLKRAHPRSRGEHAVRNCGVSVCEGSSPLARGTRRLDFRGRWSRGLIPARAGNTDTVEKSVFTPRAHPRSRGEHLLKQGVITLEQGSSPLARGTLILIPPPYRSVGLIPARAGNTFRACACRARSGAHPRSRGEHAAAGYRWGVIAGSSPLARGTRT